MQYNLTEYEKKDLEQIQNTYYMKPILARINKRGENEGWVEVFNGLYDILKDSEKDVRDLVEERRRKDKIKNVDQAIKSIVGNAFSNCLIYLFIKNKQEGNIKPHIFITSKKSRIRDFENISIIKIGDEVQKPDIDLIIYTNNSVDNLVFLSLKTSLRERVGQTYKWKLLLEIATTCDKVKSKYNITYNIRQIPIMCFATVNFYDEIKNPQNRGMFKFFDKVFIGKSIENIDSEVAEFVSPLSEIVKFVNEKLGQGHV